jgi:DNA-binding LytR/AlgR family response regulator
MMGYERNWSYWLNGSYYAFGVILEQFFYEYLKDARSYAVVLTFVYLYRHLVLRLQGEASLLGEPDINTHQETELRPKRILVKKLGREFLVKVNDIEHIEAAGNYVNLHINKRVYPLRETLTKIQQRLDETTFKRIHRSHIINLNLITEIRPLESGDAQVLLSSGRVIPMSRTYRSQFVDSRW